jgi:plasmid stability protein
MEVQLMANVLIRGISNEVLDRIKATAKRHNRSLQRELREAIENMANGSNLDVCQIAKELREKLRKKRVRFTDSAELLREDRAR